MNQEPIRTLVADDSPEICRALVAILEELRDLSPTWVGDGSECLRQLESDRQDLLIVDVLMPNVGGLGVLQRLTERPHIRPRYVATLSGFSSLDSYRRLALNLGADRVVNKPFGVKEIEELVVATESRINGN